MLEFLWLQVDVGVLETATLLLYNPCLTLFLNHLNIMCHLDNVEVARVTLEQMKMILLQFISRMIVLISPHTVKGNLLHQKWLKQKLVRVCLGRLLHVCLCAIFNFAVDIPCFSSLTVAVTTLIINTFFISLDIKCIFLHEKPKFFPPRHSWRWFRSLTLMFD